VTLLFINTTAITVTVVALAKIIFFQQNKKKSFAFINLNKIHQFLFTFATEKKNNEKYCKLLII